MSKVSNMSMEDILKVINIQFQINNIENFCKKEEIRRELCIAYKKGEDISKILIENEQYIDKEKILLNTWLDSKFQIEESRKGNFKLEEQEVRDKKNNMIRIKKLCKGMDCYIVVAHKRDNIISKIEVSSSKEEISGYSLDDKEKENKKIFDRIDKKLSNEDEPDKGMEYALQCIEIEDLYEVFPNDIAKAVNFKINHNTQVLGKEIIDKFRKAEDNENVYIDPKENKKLKIDIILPQIRESIGELLKYVDLQKLLLIAVYRFEDILEEMSKNGVVVDKDELIAMRLMSVEILKEIKKDTIIESNEINYTYEEANEFTKRIDEDKWGYIDKEELQKLKRDVINGENIGNLSKETLLALNIVAFSREEIENIMNVSPANFIFGVIKLKLPEEEIVKKAIEYKMTWPKELGEEMLENKRLSTKSFVKLYANGIIDAEFFKEFSKEINISSEINIEKINELYLELKKDKKVDESKFLLLDKKIELYKELNLAEKTKEELQEESDTLMYEIAEDFEDEDDIMFYYKNGLITTDTVIEWDGDIVVEKLYDESELSLSDVEQLYKTGRISQLVIEKVVSKTNPDYSTLISYMNKGYITENEIVSLYIKGKLFDKDFEQLARNGKVSIGSFKNATATRTKEMLEEKANITIEPILVNIPDKKLININLIEDEGTTQSDGDNYKTKTLIDPTARYEYLKLLGAKEAKADIEDENNAFYNYEFFVIPNREGKLDLNSVVIAERFYKDKEDQMEFALDNATYFFQYKDLMVNSNLTKKEMIQDRENVVFKTSHRAGNWATGVLCQIAKTMAGTDFKEYKNADERMEKIVDELYKLYNKEELEKIFSLMTKINEECNYELVEDTYGKDVKSADNLNHEEK